MSIKMPQPPQASFDTLVSGLSRLPSEAADAVGLAGGRLSWRRLESRIFYAHKVYNLGLEDVAAGKGLDQAHWVSWRYLIDQGEQGTAAAEVNYDEKAESNEFSQFNQGAYGPATLAEIQKVETSPRFSKGSYELRFLRIPALYVAAVWLHDLEGDGDVVIPIPPTAPPLEAGVDYSPSKFISLLQAPAQQKLRFDSSPRMEQAY
jgi:hypothetical protein